MQSYMSQYYSVIVKKMIVLGILFCLIVAQSNGARILGVVPTPSYSHQIVFQPLWKELSLRGHQLTVLTADPINNRSLTNLTEIDFHDSSYKVFNVNMFELAEDGLLNMFITGLQLASDLAEAQLSHPEVQALIKNNSEHFDLVLVEDLFFYAYAFVERFKCPFIELSSLDAPHYVYEHIGNPSHPVLNPDFMLPFSGQLTFLERLISTLFTLFTKFYQTYFSYPSQQAVVEKYFGKEYPLLQDIVRNTSMVFVNADPIFHQIRPLVPAVVQIGGGTHLKPPKPLPKDLQNQLDGASEGVIYFSLGSNIKSRELPEKVRQTILETLAELPYLVLWKFELEDLPGKPKNVIISKWFPQQDVLRHPNIKLFVSQGGLQSMEESMYSHVPMVVMPFFGDQPANAVRIVSKGLGLSVDYTNLEKESFGKAILEVISNPKYKNRVKELAQLARDEPMTGLERAVWWTEYVLRHKGAKHLRSPALDLPLYQYFLLDVIATCLLVVAILVFVLIKLAKLIMKCLKIMFGIVNLLKGKPKVKQQ